MSNLDTIRDAIRQHCLTDDVGVLPRGHTRVGTKMTYLDGSSIDVFMERMDENALLEGEAITLSDFGQTLAKLSEYGVNASGRAEAVKDAVRSLGIRLADDKLVVHVGVGRNTQIDDAITNLAQACVRVSCLAFTKRAPKKKAFAERVNGIIGRVTGMKLAVEKKHEYPSPFGRAVQVDYRITRTQRPAAILTLGKSHAHAAKVFCKWSDLTKTDAVKDRFITIYDDDDSQEFERYEDLARLETVSEVIGANQEDRLVQQLTAA